jgi:hypothetical protein
MGALSLVTLAACSGGAPAVPTIKIGVDLPLSGGEGQAGTPTLNGIRFFVHQHPDLDGFNIVLSERDDAVKGIHDPNTGARNFSALIGDPLVLGVIGPFDSSVARVAIPLAGAAHLAVISPATSNRCLTKEPFLPAGLDRRTCDRARQTPSSGWPRPTTCRARPPPTSATRTSTCSASRCCRITKHMARRSRPPSGHALPSWGVSSWCTRTSRPQPASTSVPS